MSILKELEHSECVEFRPKLDQTQIHVIGYYSAGEIMLSKSEMEQLIAELTELKDKMI